MAERENVQAVQRVLAAFQRGDLQQVLDCCSDDITVQNPMPMDAWPGAGAVQGKKRFSEFLTGLASVAEFEQFEPREFIAQRDKVVVNVFERARYKATGRAVDNDYVHIYTMRDGKITALRIFEDTAPLLAGMRSA